MTARAPVDLPQETQARRVIAASLIIATRNRPVLLVDTIVSILAGRSVPAEVVVLDQSDTPNPEVGRLPAPGVEIRYVHSSSVGLSRARNEGVAAASHEILVFTDDDMRAEPEWFAAMVGALEKAGPRGVVTGRVLPGEVERPGGFVPATVLNDKPAVYQGRLNTDVLAAGSMAIFRTWLAAIGGFDERLGAGTSFPAAEDNDLGFRALEAGSQIHYVPEAVLYHRAWRTSADYLPMRWRYGLGKGGFYRKHMPRTGRHMYRRVLRDLGNRLVRFPIRIFKNRRRAIGDAAYSAGVLIGLRRWRGEEIAQGLPAAHSMASPARVSVAISTVGRCAELKRCLDAIVNGERRPAEIVVVDQSGEDDVAKLLAGYAMVPIRHVRQPRRGLSAARNAALREAREEILAITDDDCVPGTHWVSVIQRCFALPDPPDAVSGRVLPLGPEKPGTWPVSTRAGTDVKEYRGRAIPWHVGTGGNFAVRKEWLERAGGYDERLGAGTAGRAGEDVDLLYRLLRLGARIRYEPAALVYHERQDASRRRSSRFSYGHGIGAFCGVTARRGDSSAILLLSRWLFLRAKIACKAAVRGNWRVLPEEVLVLRGTASGVWFGLRLQART